MTIIETTGEDDLHSLRLKTRREDTNYVIFDVSGDPRYPQQLGLGAQVGMSIDDFFNQFDARRQGRGQDLLSRFRQVDLDRQTREFKDDNNRPPVTHYRMEVRDYGILVIVYDKTPYLPLFNEQVQIGRLVRHELGNDLVAIKFFTDAVRRGDSALTEALLEGVEANLRNSKHTLDTFGDAMDIHGPKILMQPVRIYHEVFFDQMRLFNGELNERYKGLIGENGFEEVMVYGDARWLRIVVSNFLHNAITNCTKEGEICIGYEEREFLHFYVRNTVDCPIPETTIGRMFDVGFQDDEHARAGSEGLGLYLSDQVIRKHNGHMWARNVQGDYFDVGFSLQRL